MKQIILLTMLVAALGCTSSPPPSEREPEVSKPAPPSKPGDEAETPSRAKSRAPAPTPETWVFGIKIPSGMRPAKGPEKVYRFEGAQLMPQVKMLIEEQISSRQKLREIGGWLFRFAKARKSKGDKLLAIRVFEGKKAGSVLDIWEEKHYAKDLPNIAARTSTYTFQALGRPVSVPGELPPKLAEKRRASLAKTLSVMKKVETGEPLTEEEKKSDVFY
jgi:hypothetical protein